MATLVQSFLHHTVRHYHITETQAPQRFWAAMRSSGMFGVRGRDTAPRENTVRPLDGTRDHGDQAPHISLPPKTGQRNKV